MGQQRAYSISALLRNLDDVICSIAAGGSQCSRAKRLCRSVSREGIAIFHRIGDVGSLSSEAAFLEDQDAARSTR